MPQLQEAIQDLIYQQDGTPPPFYNEVRSYLDERLRNRWIGRGGPMECPGLTPIDIFL
jgi:hypothetical protein